MLKISKSKSTGVSGKSGTAEYSYAINVDPVTEAWMNGRWPIVLFSSVGIGLLFGGLID